MRDIQSKFKFYLGVGVVILGLLVFEYLGLMRVFTDFGGRVIRPMRVFAGSVVRLVEAPFFTLKGSIKAARRIKMLEERYSEVLAQLGEFKGLEEENKELRSLLENTDRQAREVVITAPVVSYVGPSLGVGSGDGVEVGDLVFVAQTLVGRIKEIDENFSQINLIYEKDFQPLVVKNNEGVTGIVKGDGRRVVFSEVMLEENPAPESRLVTMGQIGVEKDLFVGQVGKLISGVSDPVKTYQVTRLVDFYQARVVEVYK